jgi:hypothetical protein
MKKPVAFTGFLNESFFGEHPTNPMLFPGAISTAGRLNIIHNSIFRKGNLIESKLNNVVFLTGMNQRIRHYI